MTIEELANRTEQGESPEWCVVIDEHVTHYSGPMRRGGEHRVEVAKEQDGTISVTVEGTGSDPAFLDPAGVATLIADVARASAIAWPELVASDAERIVGLGARLAVLEAMGSEVPA